MEPTPTSPVERRRFARAAGPFNGWRVGAERVPVRIVHLSLGGCFVFAEPGHGEPAASSHVHVETDGVAGETSSLQIDLGGAGMVDVVAATLAHRPGGTAVTFLSLSPEAYAAIEHVVSSQRS